MARTYKRDSNGRFSSTGGARSGRPAAKPVSRGKNRITRDNAGRIASVGGEGATARGGRLRTAAGNKRAVQTARIKGSGGRLRKPVGGGQGKPATAQAPMPGRTRKQAVAAQKARIRSTIEATRGQVIGARRGVTVTAGGGEKIKIKKATVNQSNIFGGNDKATKLVTTRVASLRGPAPGSRSSRRLAGIARRAGEEQIATARKIRERARAIEDRRATKPGNYFTKKARDARSLSTKRKALEFLQSAANRAALSGGIMGAIRNSRRYTTVSNPDPSRKRRATNRRRR